MCHHFARYRAHNDQEDHLKAGKPVPSPTASRPDLSLLALGRDFGRTGAVNSQQPKWR